MSYYPSSIRPNGFIETLPEGFEGELYKEGSIVKNRFSGEEIELTCCGDEITGMVKDIGICPTCLEYI
jgi:hypothetical protein